MNFVLTSTAGRKVRGVYGGGGGGGLHRLGLPSLAEPAPHVGQLAGDALQLGVNVGRLSC